MKQATVNLDVMPERNPQVRITLLTESGVSLILEVPDRKAEEANRECVELLFGALRQHCGETEGRRMMQEIGEGLHAAVGGIKS